MISESVIWGGSKVGEYIVQATRTFRVQIMPGRMIRAWPEPQVHPLPAWAGQWVGGMRRVVVDERWILVTEVRNTYVRVDLGVVTNIEPVELVIDGPITASSPPGRYEIRTHSELVVVLIGENSCRAAHGRLISGLGSGYEGDGRMHEAEDFIFVRGFRGALAWSEEAEAEEWHGFSTSEVYRIDWQAPRRRQAK
ncbi:hypothetical protein E3O11_16350 [Cryobacterium levicorallinum]|uniref:DUF4178 domain-containing protein n=1 Tax=Cryobacterium levicorallinum TaxID=995038 RepID=A0A1I3D9Q3_9MICO|nr:hypothetical protein [Cryobacterium levicorallinum]TFB81846.1 hypothetical protein E3O11_16350 [Cryobacterium levicorallinum]GEP28251.1 hypothetical protein CLE01_28490 [Cryobacterium levicorallinum]SFH83386.1 hypothetical protein SAMN05216274_1179 [Cryobacterium levicorallinum]